MWLLRQSTDNHELHTARFINKTNTIEKTIKLVGGAAFSDRAVSCVRGFNSRDDVEHAKDRNQNIIEFSNAYLYDITTDDYRPMITPCNENISDTKAREIYTSINSLFDDGGQMQHVLKVLSL